MKKKPTYDHLRVIGSLCYASTPRKPTDKFCVRSVMIGYPCCQKGYKLYDIDKRKIFVSRPGCCFQEEIFPFLKENERENHINIIRDGMFS